MSVKCPRCRSKDTAPSLGSEATCFSCGAAFNVADGVVVFKGQGVADVPPQVEGFGAVVDADDVTVGYVDRDAKERKGGKK